MPDFEKIAHKLKNAAALVKKSYDDPNQTVSVSKQLSNFVFGEQKNPQRESFIDLLDKIDLHLNTNKTNNTKLIQTMVFLLLFEYYYILHVEYKGTPPDKTWLRLLRSYQMFQTIKNILEITDKDSISDALGLTILEEGEKYFQELPVDIFTQDFWKTKKGLIELFDKTKSLLANTKSNQQNKELLLKRPSNYSTLTTAAFNMPETYALYAGDQSSWLRNPLHWKNRTRADFVNFIYTMAEIVKQEKFHLSYKVELILAANLYVEMQIKDAYLKSLWANFITNFLFNYPEKSKVYQLSTAAINKKYLADLTPNKKSDFLTMLRFYLIYLEDNNNFLLLKYNGIAYKKKSNVIISDLENMIVFLFNENLELSKKQWVFSFILQKAVKYGLIVGGTVAVFETLPVWLVGAAVGESGIIISSATGFITLNMIEAVIPASVVSAYRSLIDFIAENISSKISEPIRITIENSATSFKRLVGFANEVLIDKNNIVKNKKWEETLLALPDSMISKDEKQIILATSIEEDDDNLIKELPPFMQQTFMTKPKEQKPLSIESFSNLEFSDDEDNNKTLMIEEMKDDENNRVPSVSNQSTFGMKRQ